MHLCISRVNGLHGLIEKSGSMHQQIAKLEPQMYENRVYAGVLALMGTPFIIPNFSALQILSDYNVLGASIHVVQCSRRAFHYIVSSNNPPTRVALTEHQI